RLSPLPIIMLTAYSDQELINKATDLPIHGYLVKPVQKGDVAAAIAVAVKLQMVALVEGVHQIIGIGLDPVSQSSLLLLLSGLQVGIGHEEVHARRLGDLNSHPLDPSKKILGDLPGGQRVDQRLALVPHPDDRLDQTAKVTGSGVNASERIGVEGGDEVRVRDGIQELPPSWRKVGKCTAKRDRANLTIPKADPSVKKSPFEPRGCGPWA
ncbi:response regulator, partial [bacterium CPR1]|nr:response regulator [bacterium CPR1]